MSSRPVIVSVDDSKLNLMFVESMLGGMEIIIKSFDDPVKASDYICRNHVDLVLTDYIMPVMDGISLIRKIRDNNCDAPIVMITAIGDDDNIKIAALQAGASDFFYKPLRLYEFQVRVKNLLIMRKNQLLLKDKAALLQQEVEKATLQIRLREIETLAVIGRASEYKDMETGNHIQRVAHYCRVIAKEIGMDNDFIDAVAYAAPLHDIGKIGIPDNVLLKPGKLTDAEFIIMKQHTVIGAEILSNAQGKYLRLGAEIALSHHERWDGTGYPYGIKGEVIPLSGRIVAISDVFDALMSKRPYKEKWKLEDAFAFIEDNSGKMFDPFIVQAFLKNSSIFAGILNNYDDEEDEA